MTKKKLNKKIRPAGEILLDLETILDELIDDHGFQWGDTLSVIYGHLMVHRPDAQEEYLNGENPKFYYGPAEEE